MESQWHQLDHMQIIWTSLQVDNHASTSSLSFYRPDALAAALPSVPKHWRQLPRKFVLLEDRQTSQKQTTANLAAVTTNTQNQCKEWLHQAIQITHDANVLSSVVLPIPLRPMRPYRLPYAMFKSAPFINALWTHKNAHLVSV